MKLYSYIVTHDTGFAPNPFFGYCTLACCKPEIRRTAANGDWIIGLTPKAKGNRIVYYMRVDEVVDSFADYWDDRRFKVKKPTSKDGVRGKCGDNIYEHLSSGAYRQLPSMHSNGQAEDRDTKEHDLSGVRVLTSDTFGYFGSQAITLPSEFQQLIVGRGHKCRFPEEVVAAFIRFAGQIGFGIFGAPTSWNEGDDSWMEIGGCKNRKNNCTPKAESAAQGRRCR
jgi:hypothetical protein